MGIIIGKIGERELKFKYPKFLILIFTFFLAYFIFKSSDFTNFRDFFFSLSYFGTFISGMMFSYGFTAAPATALLLLLAKHQNILLAGFIGGFGALIADLLIFKFIRTSFKDEIDEIEHEKIIKWIEKRVPHLIKKYIVPVIAGFIIASPLPDEIGVVLLAASTKISMRIFSLLSYILNTAGIFVILAIGNSLQ